MGGGSGESLGTSYLSCFVTACPLRASTLKLLVGVGKIKNATTVVSLPMDCKKINNREKMNRRDSVVFSSSSTVRYVIRRSLVYGDAL